MFRKMLMAAVAALAGLLVTLTDNRPSQAMPFSKAPSAGLKEISNPVELAGRRGYGRRYYYRGGYGRYRYPRYGYGHRYARYGHGYGYRYPRFYAPYYYGGYAYPWLGYGGVGIVIGLGGYGYGGYYNGYPHRYGYYGGYPNRHGYYGGYRRHLYGYHGGYGYGGRRASDR